jgi:transcription initiation factor IIE alpha subunit
MYYNTTNEEGDVLTKCREKALTQDDVILNVFKKVKDATPFEVWEAIYKTGVDYPITSIRRSINSLTNQDHIVKTNKKRDGKHGKPNYIWRYNG